MKITRRQLLRLIKESIQETKRYIGSPDGGVTPADRAFQRAEEKDMYAADVHPKIGGLMGDELENRKMGRELASAIAPPESQYAQFGELTPEEETAIDHMGFDKASEESFPEEGVEQLVDPGDLLGAMKSKSEGVLSRLGFDYVEDVIHSVSENDYETFGPMFRFQADALGCEVKDLAYIDSDVRPGSLSQHAYQAIIGMLRKMKPQGMDVPGDEEGNFGYTQMYDLGGVKLLYTSNLGYDTFTICGQ